MKKLSVGLAGVMLAVSLMGCGAESTGTESTAVESQGTEETKAAETAGEAADENEEAVIITAWHDNDEAMMNALADVVNEGLKDDNITLKFEKKSDVTGQIQLYGTDAENGPDMYLFAHDSLGSFAEMGILEPVGNLISDDKQADLLPMTIEAATYKDEQYLMPVYYEDRKSVV